jgi:YD repeat-containing protein
MTECVSPLTASVGYAMNRRAFLYQVACGAFAVGAAPVLVAAPDNVPVRALTRGPRHHWFGYYDKLQFDPTARYVLGMAVGFEHRSPRADDQIEIGMVDTARGDRWVALGTSRAWGWQQGCMLQWRPGSAREVIWNDREGDRFVARVLDTATGATRTLPQPVYALSPDGRFAVGTDFRRINDTRPGYGYAGLADPYAAQDAPAETGIYRMDLETDQVTQILSYRDVAAIPFAYDDLAGAKHWFNHLLVSPDGRRFIFLHRWRSPGTLEKYKHVGGWGTRMFTAGVDGTDLFELDPSGYTSHFVWDDAEHITAWTRPMGREPGFYRFKDRTRALVPVGAGVMTENGHNTNLGGTPDGWILNDTYPSKEDRKQTLYLYHEPTNRKVVLGRFHSPAAYQGEWRCDLHPRSDATGTKVVIDSTHGGEGRQMYLLDVTDVVA